MAKPTLGIILDILGAPLIVATVSDRRAVAQTLDIANAESRAQTTAPVAAAGAAQELRVLRGLRSRLGQPGIATPEEPSKLM